MNLLPDDEIASIRKRIIEASGSLEVAGISLEKMRDVIFTCRMKANPMQDTPSGEPKPKRESVSKPVLKGDAVDDFMG